MPNRIGRPLARKIFLAAVLFFVGGAAPIASDAATQDHLTKFSNFAGADKGVTVIYLRQRDNPGQSPISNISFDAMGFAPAVDEPGLPNRPRRSFGTR
jgi:hypothetical protein